MADGEKGKTDMMPGLSSVGRVSAPAKSSKQAGMVTGPTKNDRETTVF
jgi:hypothetical protein